MNTNKIEQIIGDYYRYLKERDRESLVTLLSSDIVITYHAQESQLPWAGTFHGIEGFDQFFSIIREYLNVVDVEIIDSISGKNKVINQCEGMWQYKKSGYVVKGSMVNVFTVTDEKITGYDVYADTAAFTAGITGLSPDFLAPHR